MNHGKRKRVIVGRTMGKYSRSRKKRNVGNHSMPRLIIDATCTTCGSIGTPGNEPLLVPEMAMRHTSTTGHVVILNGTVDDPEYEFSNVSV
jgi:hypothetical protein